MYMAKLGILDQLPAIRENLNLHDKFQRDKAATLAATQGFLQDPPDLPEEGLQGYRGNAVALVLDGNFTKALQTLERLRDANTGIVIYEIGQHGVPVVIRDSRNAKNPSVRGTEAFEMQYLNAIRAGMDIARIEDKPALKAELQKKANEFMANFSSQHSKKSQKELAALLKAEIKDLGKTLEAKGVADAYTKLNVAKDFQNFNDKHANVVTISSVKNGDETHIVVEAEVAMKGLTDDQRKQYDAILLGSGEPSWYTAMPAWEQALCKQYAARIAAGEHVIPTQLRQIAGMKNAFEKVTGIFEGGKLDVLHTSKHAGTLASLARDEGARQEITNGNAKQAKQWVGVHTTLHCNTFNSGPIGAGDDPEIVRRTTTAMKHVGGKETNTAFNAFRYSGLSNDLGGAKDSLKQLSECFKGKEFDKIKSHIQPRGFFGRLFRTGSAEKEIQNLLKSKQINPLTAKILERSVDLRRSVEKADSILRWGDAENASLATSTKLNKLTTTLSKLDPKSPPQGMSTVPTKEEILNMCASGKDRTGLAEHDQSAQAIANRIGAKVKDIDGQLLASGHTAQQAGGVYAGGATVGCYGTKSENKAGIPKSRKAALTAIVEVTSASNKIKGESKLKEPKGKVKTPEPVKKSSVRKQQTISPPVSTPSSKRDKGQGQGRS
jgi:hypothetical protein